MLGVTLATVSCKKEQISPDITTPSEPTDNPSATSEALISFFQDNLNSEKQYFTIDASSSSTITGAKGSQLTFSPNSFETSNGTVVTGNIDIQLIEIFTKAEMMMLNMPTMGQLSGNQIAPLISGGQFKITASQNGQKLNLVNGYGYSAVIPANNGVDPNMQLFYGTAGASDTVMWATADSSMLFGQGNQYNAYFDSINWVNLDYFSNLPGTQTTVQVEVPQGFDNQNCVMYVSFDGLNSLGALYNSSNNVFTSAPNYTLPVGTDIHFVAVSIIGGNPHVAIISSQITNNHYEVIPALTQTTDTQFAVDLTNLP